MAGEIIKIKPEVEDRIIKKQKRGCQKQSEGGKRRKKKRTERSMVRGSEELPGP